MNKQDGPYCLLWSAAQILGVEMQEIIDFIGHNGTDIQWPDKVGINRYRGVHIQEIIDFSIIKGEPLIHIEPMPCLAPDHNTEPCDVFLEEKAAKRCLNYLNNNNAILIGDRHAVACQDRMIIDPNGHTYDLINSGKYYKLNQIQFNFEFFDIYLKF